MKEIRAYQILNHAGKMVGKRIVAKKIDAITAYEIVDRVDFNREGRSMLVNRFAYRIVEAVITDKGIQETETAQGGDELTFDACVNFIASYRKFHAAPVKTSNDIDESGVVEKWNGVIEFHFESDTKLDSDEILDMLYQMKERARNGGDKSRVVIDIPKGLSLSKIELPDDAVYLPE